MKSKARSVAVSCVVMFGARLCVAQQTVAPVSVSAVATMRCHLASGFAHAGVTAHAYSLLATETSIQTTADGTKITKVHTERRLRDDEGRTRTDVSILHEGKPELQYTTIVDPVALTSVMLHAHSKQAIVEHLPECVRPNPTEEAARLQRARERAAAAPEKDAARPPQHGDFTIERLPVKQVAGFEASGLRTTRIIPVGKEGNDREMRSTHEFWTSVELGIEVGSIQDDPRLGRRETVVTGLQLANPPLSEFQIPADYKLTETTRTAQR